MRNNRHAYLYLAAVGWLGFFLILFLLPPTYPPEVTPTPNIVTVVVTSTPQIVAATVTSSPVTATQQATKTSVPDLGTPAQPAKTATPTPICRSGVITAHDAMPAVLATKPERACEGCTYFASVLCQDIGRKLDLRIQIRLTTISLPVVVVDCASWQVGDWPQKGGRDWLGELDIRAWPEGAAMAPMEVQVCE